MSVLVATAGRAGALSLPRNAFVADYLPGIDAAARSALVICNGGSPTTLQALVSGVPVIGIASNLDQYLNIDYVERAGAGRILRAEALTVSGLNALCKLLLGDPMYKRSAATLQRQMTTYDPISRLEKFIDTLHGPTS